MRPNPAHIPEFTAKMKGCKYKFGAKVAILTTQLADVKEIDCSGFFRLIWFKSTGVRIPDGTWNQNLYFLKNEYVKGKTRDCFKRDGKLRALVMPSDGKAIGHIAYVLNGRTYESWGGHGPGSRLFTGLSGFQRKARVYEITK